MKTKSFLLICCVGFFISSIVSAQSSESYYSFSAKKTHFYDSLRAVTPDTLKVAGWRSFQRWNDFWRDRVYNSSTVTGSYSMYSAKLQAAISNPAWQADNSTNWNWQLAGDQNLTTHNRGLINSLWVNPSNIDEIYAGSNTSGLFRTINGGTSWECVTDNINLHSMGVNDIAVNPINTNIKYIAHSLPFGGGAAYIQKTSDNCATWQTVLALPETAHKAACRIVLDPTNPDILYALMFDVVYRSIDAGANWQLIFDQLTYSSNWDTHKMLLDIEFKPNDHNTVFITGNGYTVADTTGYTHSKSAELWVTTNATNDSVIWQHIEMGLPEYCDRYALSVDPLNPSYLYVGYSIAVPGMNNWGNFNIKKMNIPSYSFEHIFDRKWGNSYGYPFAGLGYWSNGFKVSPTNSNIMFCGGYNLEVLNMATKKNYDSLLITFAPHLTFHVDQRVFKTATSNGKTYLFCGNDGGVSRYEYETKIMKSCNGPGLDNNQYYGIGHSEASTGFYIGGTQDNGVIGNGNGFFKATIMGDAYEVIVDPVQPDTCYATANGGSKSIVKSNDHFNSYSYLHISGYTGGLNDRPFVMSPSDRNTLYVGYSELFRTTNATSAIVSWQKISNFQDTIINTWRTTDGMKAIGLTKANQISSLWASQALHGLVPIKPDCSEQPMVG